MKTSRIILLSGMVLLLAISCAHSGDAGEAGRTLSRIIEIYRSQTSTWETVVMRHARTLFWNLALIGFAVNFGYMVMGGNLSMEKMIEELLKFAFLIGFFYWLLDKGTEFAKNIIDSFVMLGEQASSSSGSFSPSGIIGIGFDVFKTCTENTGIFSPFISLGAILIGAAVVVICALMAGVVLIMICSSWVLIYSGVFFVAFGGLQATRDIAINYFKTVITLGANVLVMILLTDTAVTVLKQMCNDLKEGDGFSLTWLGAILGFAGVMFMMVQSTPAMIAGIVSGASMEHTSHIGGAGMAGTMAAAHLTKAAVSGGASFALSSAGAGIGFVKAMAAANRNVNSSGYKGGRMGKVLQVGKEMAGAAWGGGEGTLAEKVARRGKGGGAITPGGSSPAPDPESGGAGSDKNAGTGPGPAAGGNRDQKDVQGKEGKNDSPS